MEKNIFDFEDIEILSDKFSYLMAPNFTQGFLFLTIFYNRFKTIITIICKFRHNSYWHGDRIFYFERPTIIFYSNISKASLMYFPWL
jgi:hypothetical protein